MKKIVLTSSSFFIFISMVIAQPDRWQQRVKYTMNVDVNVETNRFSGTQKLVYWNNSPDTLKKVFYHMYWNAFQPNSMMDVRSRRQGSIVVRKDKNGNDVVDWDNRVKDRIYNLNENEIGYQKAISLKMNGQVQPTKLHETILEVMLTKPILPNTKVVFDMEFEAQIPLQIRRSGRDNPTTKVRYSMSQWYPKMCEYDYEGWHPTPYIAREFYGIWGDFDVKINIDKSYVLGGTGYLQNPAQIGYGYEAPGTKVVRPAGNKLTWHFVAPNVHDFMWAADPEYKHVSRKVREDLTIHVLYKSTDSLAKKWENILNVAEKALPYIEKHFGVYPYKQYSFIHGGDGGMEYAMSTLLASPGNGVVIHEWMHNWYQGLLATNESLYGWMDEGFTTYAEDRVNAYLDNKTGFIQQGSYDSYLNLAKSGREEPLSTHADHYDLNAAYSPAVYSKGAVFMEQLGYIVGENNRDKILLDYYTKWRFKHPNVNDLMKIAEKQSGMKLDWYKEYWINSTKTIDYKIDSLWEENGVSKIRIRNEGLMPMPIDLQLNFKDGSKELHYVPMYLMFGEKPAESKEIILKTYEPWKWTHATYIIETNRKLLDLVSVEIDPSLRMADINRKNNKLETNW